jgi:hypothetical protein
VLGRGQEREKGGLGWKRKWKMQRRKKGWRRKMRGWRLCMLMGGLVRMDTVIRMGMPIMGRMERILAGCRRSEGLTRKYVSGGGQGVMLE